MKHLCIVVSMLFSFFVLFSCGSSKKPSAIVEKYLNAEKSGDYATAYELISQSDKNAKSFEQFDSEKKEEFGLLFTPIVRKSMNFKIAETQENGESATVKVELTRKDYSSVVAEMLGQAFSSAIAGDDSDKIAEDMKTKLSSGEVPTTTETMIFSLKKESDYWVIFFDWERENKIKELSEKAEKLKDEKKWEESLSAYTEILSLDADNEDAKKNTSEISETLKKIQERKDYIKNIEVYDFNAKYYEQYFGDKEAGVVFKLRNKGDKELALVEMTISFKDSSNTVIYEQKSYPINKNSLWNSTTLKPNHIWQPKQNTYYSVDSVPSEWQEGNASIAITDVEFVE